MLDVTWIVWTTVAFAVAVSTPSAVNVAAMSKEAAETTTNATLTETSWGTGVGGGVGGMGVGASERGVTSISSVSLVSFIPISAINFAVSPFTTLLR
jgi:hypothetical protein